MKVLQLFNNWKWTGPAEYAFNLTQMLKKRGIDTVFACSPPPKEANESLLSFAIERGITPVTNFKVNKHLSFRNDLDDYPKLIRFMSENDFTIVHTHLTNGHLLAGLAARKASARPAVVRTCYDSDGGGMRDRLLYQRLTDGIVAVADCTRRAILARGRIPPDKVRVIPAAIDTNRFQVNARLKDNRARWGIASGVPVVGMVARVQKRRRFDIFFEAIAGAVRELPDLKAMIVGRGTNIAKVAIEPARAMGLEKHIIFTDFRKDDYVETLNCFDMMVLLVPGSDDSCRAVREAMALGKPIIVSRRGMLPEIVDHERNGLVIDDDPETLADAIVRLAQDKALREKLGRAASRKAVEEFALDKQFPRVVEFYEELIRRKASGEE